MFCLAYPYHHSLDGGSNGSGGAEGDAAAEAGKQQQQGQQQHQHLVVDEGVLLCHAQGRFSAEQLLAAMDACRRACSGVAKFSRMSLVAGFAVRCARRVLGA